MRAITVSKLTLNIGAGRDKGKLEKGMKLIEQLAGIKPVQAITQKRIPTWGLRPGLPVGCKLTLRGKAADEMLRRLMYAKDNKLKATSFDKEGNFAFGVKEYVDIKDAKYAPELGMMGLEATVTLERPGYRVRRRQQKPSRLGKNHVITREESINFLKENFGAIIDEE